MKENSRIAFNKNSIVYDEKISSGTAVETQRSRWLYSYFQNMPNALALLFKGLINKRWNQFFFGWITLSPPLFVLVLLSVLTAGLALLIYPILSLILVIALVVFSLNFLWVLKVFKAPEPVWQSLWKMPIFVLRQFFALFKMINPHKNFTVTENTKRVNIEEILD